MWQVERDLLLRQVKTLITRVSKLDVDELDATLLEGIAVLQSFKRDLQLVESEDVFRMLARQWGQQPGESNPITIREVKEL